MLDGAEIRGSRNDPVVKEEDEDERFKEWVRLGILDANVFMDVLVWREEDDAKGEFGEEVPF